MALVPWKRNQETAVARRPEEGFVPLRKAMDLLLQESFLAPSLFDRVFDGFGSFSASDGTNLWETNDSYIVQIALPGANPDSIDCTVDGTELRCRAESAVRAPEKATPIWQSYGGQTEYRVQLPSEVEPDKAQATYEHGILTITMPKAAHARAKSIKVVAK
jgi:HSP20 family protein